MKALSISDAEWQIMKAVWKGEPCGAQEIMERISATNTWSPATTKTLINRLVKKKALGFRKVGRSYQYHALATEAECRHRETESFLGRVFDGSLSPLLSYFAERGGKLKEEEIRELERILRNARK